MTAVGHKYRLVEQQLDKIINFLRPLDDLTVLLNYSYKRCKTIDLNNINRHDGEKLDALIIRFIRLSDIFLQTVFSLLERGDSKLTTSIHAKINHARQKGILASTSDMIMIYELCNMTLKGAYSLKRFYRDFLNLTSKLIASIKYFYHYIKFYILGKSN